MIHRLLRSRSSSALSPLLRLLRRLHHQHHDVLSPRLVDCLTPLFDPLEEDGLAVAQIAADALSGVVVPALSSKALICLLQCIEDARVLALVQSYQSFVLESGRDVVTDVLLTKKKALECAMTHLNQTLAASEQRSVLLGLLRRCVTHVDRHSAQQVLHCVFKAMKSEMGSWSQFFNACCVGGSCDDALAVVAVCNAGLFFFTDCDDHTQKRILTVVKQLAGDVSTIEPLLTRLTQESVAPVTQLLLLLSDPPNHAYTPFIASAAVEATLTRLIPSHPFLLSSLFLLTRSLSQPHTLLSFLALLPRLNASTRRDFYLLLRSVEFALGSDALTIVVEDAFDADDVLAVAALSLLGRHINDELVRLLIEKEALVAGITTKWRTMTKSVLKPVRENQIRVLR